MGAAIAARLMDVGHQVTVWNRSADKTKALAAAGAKVAATPAEVAKQCEAVITILADANAIDAVYNGPSGLLSGNPAGKLFIEMSTVLPATATALAAKARAKGAALVECPVGGSTGPAKQGQLLGLMGAEPADAARAKPLLDQLCRRLEHCGPVGTGSAMKLAINLPLMVAWQAYGEAFAICRDVGFSPKRLLDLFVDTNGANPALKNRAQMIVTMFEGGDPGPTTFSISNACKDLRVMLDAAKAKGVELPTIERSLACFEEARQHGLADADGSALSVYWAKRKAP
jgi:3-hydroxyisobutyrate dehydrogenase